jgi:hypothetical protein
VNETAITTWQPARRHPETYPGDCPAGSYLILDDEVHPLAFARDNELASAYVVIDGEDVPLDPVLFERGVPPLADRHVSLAYGANRNPGTLAIKMQNYRYSRHDDGLVLPVLKGATRGRDVVACGLSGQGYLYADLLLAEDGQDEALIEAWFPLLDPDQLRVMHDGEHVREGLYTVARFPSSLDRFDHPVEALGYAGNDPIFVSPVLGQPVAYSTVHVDTRSLPAMDAVQMIDHILDVGDLRPRVSDLTQVVESSSMTRDVMSFMNKRWWIRFEGHEQPDDRYDQLIGALNAVVAANQHPHSSAATMVQRGLALAADEAYEPDTERTLGAQLRRQR